MALTGVHVAFGYSGGEVSANNTYSLRKPAVRSGPPMTGTSGTSSASAPPSDQKFGSPIARIATSKDIFYSVGQSPDAVNGPRDFLFANTEIDMVCNPGDKVAFVEA